MLSKESKHVAIAPFPGLGCHPRVVEGTQKSLETQGLRLPWVQYGVCVWRGCSLLWVPLP